MVPAPSVRYNVWLEVVHARKNDGDGCEAGDCYVKTDYACAIRKAKEALKYLSDDRMAIQIIGVSSCYLNKIEQARWALEKLPPKKKRLVGAVCRRNGIQL